ncbi:MAG: hypothetical protein HYY78_22410 [Betaproteobacteria bacterium]|nr:hypothetical protein [Betaproteobacteria bacterium]
MSARGGRQARIAAAIGLLCLLALPPIDAVAQQGKPKVPPQLPPQAAEQAQQQVAANTAPTVSLSAPANNALYTAPATVPLEASAAASSSGRSIAKVEFFADATLIGSVSAAPYSFTWTPVAAGAYSLTARATDNLGVAMTSAPVSIVVNAPPTVDLTAPVNNALFTAPATIALTAAAADADGSVAQVEFFQGATLLATMASEPYTFSLANVAAGTLTFTARATDDRGAVTTSTAVAVLVNAPPTVNLTSPTADADFRAPASITLTTEATDSDGTIANVQFYNGATLIATRTEPPYSIIWSGVPAGSYSLTARVMDNLGAATTSDATSVTVTQALAQIYYIHTDHLNTPRAIYDQQQRLVWRWDQTDPFGGNPPNENPSGLGTFTCNLRLPGQYFDRETNTHYNYRRDYDPAIGRYVQSDPIGLVGGINTYAYVDNDPLRWADRLGLRTFQCTKPLNALTDKFGSGVGKFAHDWLPAAYHQYSCIVDKNGKVTCGGQDHAGSALRGPGKPSEDSLQAGQCKEIQPDNNCFEQCLNTEWGKPRPTYGIPFGTDCQEYDDDLVKRCRKQCDIKK